MKNTTNLRFTLITGFVLMVIIPITGFKKGQNAFVVSDYKEVKIGNQIWMTENLNVDKFRNGDPIPQAKNKKVWYKYAQERKPAWCYYLFDDANGAKYGKLYNWYAVMDERGLAPAGWHIPTSGEFVQLADTLGGLNFAGRKLKSASGWNEADKKIGDGTNESGFNALPSGFVYDGGAFHEIGESCWLWTSTKGNDYTAICYTINFRSNALYKEEKIRGNGNSVRCVKD